MFGRKKRKEEALRSLLTEFIMASRYEDFASQIKNDTATLGIAIAYAYGASYSYAEPAGLSMYNAANNAFKVFCVNVAGNPDLLDQPFRNVVATVEHDESVAFVFKLGGFVAAKFFMQDYEFVDVFEDLMNWDRTRITERLLEMEKKYALNFGNEFRDAQTRYEWLGR